jgi:hypothetical protein
VISPFYLLFFAFLLLHFASPSRIIDADVVALFFVFMRPALEIATNPFRRARANIHCCYERLVVAISTLSERRVG